MVNPENNTAILTREEYFLALSLGTPCLICEETVTISRPSDGVKICDRCKKAVLHIRQQLERNPCEPILD